MRSFRFDPGSDLIRVEAVVAGLTRRLKIRMALDTGSTETLLMPHVIELVGYGDQNAIRRTVIRGPLGSEPGYLLRVHRFTALGFSMPDFTVHAHALPPDHGIDGLLGLSFLRHFNYEIRSPAGVINIDRAPP